ncbi:hypothetical protein PICMEDRAFT_70060 [Pichia membranifaciens NRRL Y-2026]|uniref:UBX domain-containing protein n=1 Tax=Pichia membranifaciens NRRL Y-2026 TaxID=763406 RepID=A0A1E3NS69_9ASCO|nr:hypothetical protein PICMEDRAFT_70060 [Pichia membranifaciens NRRL Y-2026]ODQ48423.1 hypothetical protein PICMEDRAFT_70060 [Pichia membranifaciens NRRL Y-2026]
MDSITPEEQNVLDQFEEITNYDKENESTKVLRLLTVCNWNLEVAIARYFDNDFPQLFDEVNSQGQIPLSSMSTPASASNTVATPTHSIAGSDNIGAAEDDFFRAPLPIPPTTQTNFLFPFPEDAFIPKLHRALPISNKWKFQAGLINSVSNKNTYKYSRLLTPFVFLLMLMPKVLLFLGYGLNRLFGNFAPKLFRILGLRAEEDDFPSKPVYNADEQLSSYDVHKYIDDFLGKEISLPIFKGEFNAAFDEARNNFKWFCVVLFNSESPSSEKLITNFLANDLFVKFIKNNDVVLYVGDVLYPEPFEVGQTYSAFGLPYLALIANVSATGMTHPEFSFVCKYNKLLTGFGSNGNGIASGSSVSRLCKKLNRLVSKYEPQLVAQRYDKQEAECSRLIREQQDSAYQESLLKDMKRQKEREQKQNEEEEKLRREREEKLRIEQQILKRKECAIRYINEKYDRDCSSWERGDFTTIQFRTNKGQRFIRKFGRDDTALDIFKYVSGKKLIDEMMSSEDNEFSTEDEVLQSLKNYPYQFDEDTEQGNVSFSFDLISPMPRLRLQPVLKKVNQIKEIWPNGSLLIEKGNDDDDNDDDDDDDDDDDEGNDEGDGDEEEEEEEEEEK